MDKKVLGTDFDDVLIDFNGRLLDHHNEFYGTHHKWGDLNTYFKENTWNCTQEEAVRRIIEFYNHEHHSEIPAMHGALEALREIKPFYRIVVITSRPDFIKERTLELANKYYGDIFDEIHFTNQFAGTGKVRTKLEVCDELGVEVFIDDFLGFAEEVLKTGRKVLLFDRPWNQGELKPGMTRVKTWPEIVEILKQEV